MIDADSSTNHISPEERSTNLSFASPRTTFSALTHPLSIYTTSYVHSFTHVISASPNISLCQGQTSLRFDRLRPNRVLFIILGTLRQYTYSCVIERWHVVTHRLPKNISLWATCDSYNVYIY